MKARVASLLVAGVLCLLLLAMFPSAMFAQTDKQWVGGDGLWSDPDKWSPPGVPTPTDNVSITADGTYTVTLTGGVSVNSLTVGASGNTGTQTLWVQGSNAGGNGDLYVGGALTNAGTIRLESIDGGYGSDLYINSGGTLTNTGVINVNQGTAGPRYLTGNITNQGTINVTSDSVYLQTGTFDFNSTASFNLVSGAVLYASNMVFNLPADAAFTIPAGTTLNTSDTVFNQAGTLTVNGTANFYGTFNQNGGTTAIGGNFYLWSGTFNANGGAVSIPNGGYLVAQGGAATFLYNGSTITGAPVIYSANLQITAPGAVTFVVRGSSNLLSDIHQGQTLWVQGSYAGGNGDLYVGGALTNAGTIRLESIDGGYGSDLYINSGGTLTNTGVINVNQGTAGPRYLTGNITNQGTINVTSDSVYLQTGTFDFNSTASFNLVSGAVLYASNMVFNLPADAAFTIPAGTTLNTSDTVFNQAGTLTVNGTANFYGTFNQNGGTVAVAGNINLLSGTFNANGGAVSISDGGYLVAQGGAATFVYNGSTINGVPVIYYGNLQITAPGAVTFVVRGSSNLLSDIHQGQTLWVQGNGSTGHSSLNVNSGITNAGTIRLESVDGGYQSDLYINSGILTNTGIINVNQGTAGPRYLTGNITNQGTINVTSDSFYLQTGTFDFNSTGSFNLVSGAVLYANSMVVNLPANATFTIPAGATLNASDTTFNQAGTLTVNGTANFYGTFNQTGTTTVNGTVSGTVTFNQNGGTIAVNPGASMTTGTFNANSGVLNIAEGGYFGVHSATLSYNGSTINGVPVIYYGNLQITVPGAVTFIVRGTSNLLSDIPQGYTVWVQGNGSTGHSSLNVNSGITNAGTIRLESVDGGYQSDLYINSGILTNTGIINVNQGTAGPRYLTGNITNQGTINVTSDSFYLQTGTFDFNSTGSFNLVSGAVLYANSMVVNLPANATFTIPAGATLNASDTTFNQAGTLTVNGTANFYGTFNQTGTTTVNGTVSGTVTFNQNGGTIAVNPGASMTTGTFNANSGVLNIAEGGYFGVHSATLSYNGSTINGVPVIYYGNLQITVPGAVTFIVRGTSNLLSDIPQGYTVWVQGNGSTGHSSLNVNSGITNAGTIRLESVDGGYQSDLYINSGILTNTGIINVNQGTAGPRYLTGNITNQGTINVTSDSFYLQTGTFDFNSTGSFNLVSGAVLYANSMVVNLPANATFTIPAGATLNASDTTFNQAGTLTVNGTANFYGTFNQTGTTTVNGTVSGTVTFNQNGGTIAVNPGASMTTGTFNANSGVLNIAEGGYFGVHSATLSYNGSTINGVPVIYYGNLQITVPGAVTFIVRGTSNLLSDIPQGYTVWVQGNGSTGHSSLNVNSGITNAGTIRLESVDGGYQSDLYINSGILTNTGIINVNQGTAGPRYLTGNITNQGTINVTSDSFYLQTGTFKSLAPGTIGGGGTLYLGADSNFFGSGNVSANVNSNGQVNIGASPGILNINGTYTQSAGGILNIELGGHSPGTGFDQLNITGPASLSGTLNVTLTNSFLPNIADQFQFMTYASRDGDFSTTNGVGVDLGNGVTLSRAATATDQTLLGYATPVTQYSLTMAVSGSGSTDPAVGNHTYAAGTVVNISANPTAGWHFAHWTGSVADINSATTTVTMNGNKTIIANFAMTTIGVGGEVAAVNSARVLGVWGGLILVAVVLVGLGGLVVRRRRSR